MSTASFIRPRTSPYSRPARAAKLSPVIRRPSRWDGFSVAGRAGRAVGRQAWAARVDVTWTDFPLVRVSLRADTVGGDPRTSVGPGPARATTAPSRRSLKVGR